MSTVINMDIISEGYIILECCFSSAKGTSEQNEHSKIFTCSPTREIGPYVIVVQARPTYEGGAVRNRQIDGVLWIHQKIRTP